MMAKRSTKTKDVKCFAASEENEGLKHEGTARRTMT